MIHGIAGSGVGSDGIATLLLVDSANTVDERFCCRNPGTQQIVLGAATVATDYEGGV